MDYVCDKVSEGARVRVHACVRVRVHACARTSLLQAQVGL